MEHNDAFEDFTKYVWLFLLSVVVITITIIYFRDSEPSDDINKPTNSYAGEVDYVYSGGKVDYVYSGVIDYDIKLRHIEYFNLYREAEQLKANLDKISKKDYLTGYDRFLKNFNDFPDPDLTSIRNILSEFMGNNYINSETIELINSKEFNYAEQLHILNMLFFSTVRTGKEILKNYQEKKHRIDQNVIENYMDYQKESQ